MKPVEHVEQVVLAWGVFPHEDGSIARIGGATAIKNADWTAFLPVIIQGPVPIRLVVKTDVKFVAWRMVPEPVPAIGSFLGGERTMTAYWELGVHFSHKDGCVVSGIVAGNKKIDVRPFVPAVRGKRAEQGDAFHTSQPRQDPTDGISQEEETVPCVH